MAEVLEREVNVSGTNVTLTTTTETLVISSGPVVMPRQTARIVVTAWAELTTGTATTAVKPNIRRGTTTSGTAVGEANAITIGAAAGGTEVFQKIASEQRANENTVEYSLTLQQVGATGNGTVLQAGIIVDVIGG